MIADRSSNELRQEGDEHVKQGRHAEGLESYDRALKNDPTDTQTLIHKALVLLARGDSDAALECYDQVISILPHEATPLIVKGEVLGWLGRHKEAIACIDLALAIDGTSAATWRMRGLALKNLGRFDEALASYDQALQINSNDSQNLSGKADVLLGSRERFAEAFELYEKAQASPDSLFQAPEWALRGSTLFDAGHVGEAIAYYDKALDIDPKYSLAWRGKGLVRRSEQKLDEALRCFEQALAIDPKNDAIWVDKGGILSDKGEFEAATICYDEALKLNPRNSFALGNKGVVCQNQAQFQEAVEWYDKAIEADSARAFLWENKGTCLVELAKLDEAIICYDEAIRLEPRSVWAWNNKGWIYARQGKHEEALESFDKAIEADSKKPLPWVNKADTLRTLGRIDDAVSCLESALGVVSDERDVLSALANLFADDKFDDERALEYFHRLLKGKPDDMSAKTGVVELLIKLGRYSEGRACAVEVARAANETRLQCVVQYLVLVSHAFEDGNTSTEFQELIERFANHRAKSGTDSTGWDFRGLTNTIRKSGVPSETKFLLLTLIDLQLGKIDAANLSFFESPTAVS